MELEPVSFVGVGRMGANMARRLREVGRPVVAVYDAHRPAAEALAAELGCAAPATLAEVVADANVVITVVSDDAGDGTHLRPVRRLAARRGAGASSSSTARR